MDPRTVDIMPRKPYCEEFLRQSNNDDHIRQQILLVYTIENMAADVIKTCIKQDTTVVETSDYAAREHNTQRMTPVQKLEIARRSKTYAITRVTSARFARSCDLDNLTSSKSIIAGYWIRKLNPR